MKSVHDIKNQYYVEKMGPDDLSALMELESLCFNYHWSEKQFKLGLERGAFHVLGVRDGDKISGYLAYSILLDEMEILNLGVRPESRRKGIGLKLMLTLLQKCRDMGIQKGLLDVKKSNTPAIRLYESLGFKKTGVRKKYYPDTKEDAILYNLDLNES
ncbi:ribosomal protein S18-alanine N-acetyltransferase [Maridesulfovibrio bastinii]|jgi:ribosomal-protein-alanine N-acetyltransferase|uniref:ribosomal protein S18-alanine N-acetyltransferase n=1 Tax=Maridesulfovibrio bastinii TaxID=47157 RepID=UPI000404A3A6|nr:ribosomal protein S18-alanine N-acetyltransferase [Maridesulfovibrio bastinii]